MNPLRHAQRDDDELQGAALPAHSWSANVGPGLVTVASDNDPSGIATYTLAGASYGFDMLWVCVLSYPSTAALQLIAARIAAITGRGLTWNMREHYAPVFFYFAVARFLFANAFNIAVDVLAMGIAVRTLIGGSLAWVTLLCGGVSMLLQFKVRFARYAVWVKWLTIALFSYAGVLVVVDIPWKMVAIGSFIPRIEWSEHFVGMLIAVLGTTVSPYLMFAQAEQKVAESRRKENAAQGAKAGLIEKMRGMRRDTLLRTLLSNACSFCILAAAAATLHGTRGANLDAHLEMAWVLRPVAHGYAHVVLAFALIGTALLTLPPLAGSAAQAVASVFVDELDGQNDRRMALLLGAIMLAGIFAALALPLWHVDLVRALYWSALMNGMTVTPVLFLLVLLSMKREAVGDLNAHWALRALAWLAVIATGALIVAHFWLSFF